MTTPEVLRRLAPLVPKQIIPHAPQPDGSILLCLLDEHDTDVGRLWEGYDDLASWIAHTGPDVVIPLLDAAAAPIPMILHCPRCHAQHVDAPDPPSGWENPPHRSHLCHACACVWRPADVATTGVAAIETHGERDTDLGSELAIERAYRILGPIMGAALDFTTFGTAPKRVLTSVHPERLSEITDAGAAVDLEARLEEARRERDAYKLAKAQNDERFMIERDEARRERDAAIAERDAALATVRAPSDRRACSVVRPTLSSSQTSASVR